MMNTADRTNTSALSPTDRHSLCPHQLPQMRTCLLTRMSQEYTADRTHMSVVRMASVANTVAAFLSARRLFAQFAGSQGQQVRHQLRSYIASPFWAGIDEDLEDHMLC